MTKEQIEQMAKEAAKRLKEWINRSAGQHQRAMKQRRNT